MILGLEARNLKHSKLFCVRLRTLEQYECIEVAVKCANRTFQAYVGNECVILFEHLTLDELHSIDFMEAEIYEHNTANK